MKENDSGRREPSSFELVANVINEAHYHSMRLAATRRGVITAIPAAVSAGAHFHGDAKASIVSGFIAAGIATGSVLRLGGSEIAHRVSMRRIKDKYL